jgi:hypothetical protein
MIFFLIFPNPFVFLPRFGASQAVALGLYPLTSMLNHACAGNVAHSFDLQHLGRPLLVVAATRPIAAGDECCYSYVPPHLPYAERAALLLKGYGFQLPPENA